MKGAGGVRTWGSRMNAALVDWRQQVRAMAPVPLFSSRWFSMLTSIQSVTDAAMEEQKKSGADQYTAVDLGAPRTLWERNELIVRYMLEEGKLNVALRLLTDFKTHQRNEKFALALQAAKAAEPSFKFEDLGTIKLKAAMYEHSLGLLLHTAFRSIETLQTLDFNELLQHISQTLIFSLSHPEMAKSPDADHRQEVLCLYYLAMTFTHLEDLNEDRIMELLQQETPLPARLTRSAPRAAAPDAPGALRDRGMCSGCSFRM